jgi:hypothetical protein
MKSQRSILAAGAVLGLLGAAVSPAAADWLVTREGGRIETRGAWEVKGRSVVFQAIDGSLSSVRAADVDLEASRRLTGEAARQGSAAPAAPARPVQRKSVRSFTDKDFRSTAPQPALAPDAADAAENAAPAAAPASASASTPTGSPEKPEILQVSNWDRSTDPDGGWVVITGVLRNAAQASATNIRLTVSLQDENGSLVQSSVADVSTSALMPGEQAGFRAAFPGVFSFSDVRFESESLNLRIGASPETAPVPAGR